jgi:predicted helicase
MEWKVLTPNDYGDWISMRNESFDSFIPIEPEKKFDLKTNTFFNTYAVAVNTGRDAWCYNFSSNQLEKNMDGMISFYNNQSRIFTELAKTANEKLIVENIIDNDVKI